jgi:hypothetical protein
MGAESVRPAAEAPSRARALEVLMTLMQGEMPLLNFMFIGTQLTFRKYLLGSFQKLKEPEEMDGNQTYSEYLKEFFDRCFQVLQKEIDKRVAAEVPPSRQEHARSTLTVRLNELRSALEPEIVKVFVLSEPSGIKKRFNASPPDGDDDDVTRFLNWKDADDGLTKVLDRTRAIAAQVAENEAGDDDLTQLAYHTERTKILGPRARQEISTKTGPDESGVKLQIYGEPGTAEAEEAPEPVQIFHSSQLPSYQDVQFLDDERTSWNEERPPITQLTPFLQYVIGQVELSLRERIWVCIGEMRAVIQQGRYNELAVILKVMISGREIKQLK